MNTITKLLDYEITPRKVCKNTRDMIANYALVYQTHPVAFQYAMDIHLKIGREADKWSHPLQAKYRLWRGAVAAATHLVGQRQLVSFAKDQHERSHNFYAYVYGSSGERYTIERWAVYPSKLREFTMWRCSCKDHAYRAPQRDAAPTLDAPVVKYCKHIFTAVLVAFVRGQDVEPVPAEPGPVQPSPVQPVTVQPVTVHPLTAVRPLAKTAKRLRSFKRRHELVGQAFGRSFDPDEEHAKRRVVLNQMAIVRDRANAKNGRRLKRKMSPAARGRWEHQLQQSKREAEELFT